MTLRPLRTLKRNRSSSLFAVLIDLLCAPPSDQHVSACSVEQLRRRRRESLKRVGGRRKEERQREDEQERVGWLVCVRAAKHMANQRCKIRGLRLRSGCCVTPALVRRGSDPLAPPHV